MYKKNIKLISIFSHRLETFYWEIVPFTAIDVISSYIIWMLKRCGKLYFLVVYWNWSEMNCLTFPNYLTYNILYYYTICILFYILNVYTCVNLIDTLVVQWNHSLTLNTYTSHSTLLEIVSGIKKGTIPSEMKLM